MALFDVFFTVTETICLAGDNSTITGEIDTASAA
jgi:hypothetical protein